MRRGLDGLGAEAGRRESQGHIRCDAGPVLRCLKGGMGFITRFSCGTYGLQVARWLGHPMGAQLDMFEAPDRTPIADRAYDEGKQASIENRSAKPSYAPETEAYRSYMSGYHDHQRELAGGLKAPTTSH